MPISTEVPSVNYHLWKPCNMRCGFCFATFDDVKQDTLPKGHLSREDSLLLVDMLAQWGFEKINFAGGEPTLCPWLSDLIALAKERGMVTSIVTNGSRITSEWLDGLNGNLDWIALSIDTVDPEKLKRSGRAVQNNPISRDGYLQIIGGIKRNGIRLKINTVVTSATWEEDFASFIRAANPERWKILQALAIDGQNDGRIDKYAINAAQFERYVERNRSVESEGIVVVPENNEMMTGSYIMVDPAGRFFDNTQGAHTYSSPILDVGIAGALGEVSVNAERFRQRGGRYAW